MIVFHGSYVEIRSPDVYHSRKYLDFGKGFYITPIREQAVAWANRFKHRGKNSVLSAFEFDIGRCRSACKFVEFDGYTEEWLDFIVLCRKGNRPVECDVLIGGVADDRVFNTVELYLNDLIGKGEAIKRLRYERPNVQMCIASQSVLDEYVRFTGSEVV